MWFPIRVQGTSNVAMTGSVNFYREWHACLPNLPRCDFYPLQVQSRFDLILCVLSANGWWRKGEVVVTGHGRALVISFAVSCKYPTCIHLSSWLSDRFALDDIIWIELGQLATVSVSYFWILQCLVSGVHIMYFVLQIFLLKSCTILVNQASESRGCILLEIYIVSWWNITDTKQYMVTYIPNDISLFPMEGLLIPVSKFLIFVFCISLLHFLLRGQNRIDIVTQIRILCMPSFILKRTK